MNKLLTVVTCVFNPAGFQSHHARYKAFAAQMHFAGVRLITVECAFGDADFEVTSAIDPDHLQVRARHSLWIKENLLNLGITKSLTPYVMWCDADLFFDSPDWVRNVCAVLEHYDVVQPFMRLKFLNADGTKVLDEVRPVLAHVLGELPTLTTSNVCNGGAWAMRRSAFYALGGLFDLGILGDADDIMAYSFLGRVEEKLRSGTSDAFRTAALRWQSVAHDLSTTFLPHTVYHRWHGPTKRRGYDTRWQILATAGFDPDVDLLKNVDGVWELATARDELAAQIHNYFCSRMEDRVDDF